MWQMAKKNVIMTKIKNKIDAIEICMRIWLNGTIFGKMSSMTLMSSLRSAWPNNEEMKSLWSDGIEETVKWELTENMGQRA